MPRDIPVGNRKLLICFDRQYALRDLYFPHVGQENQIAGDLFRFGVWVDGEFSWVGPGWEIDLAYIPDTLVTKVILRHEGLGVRLTCHDSVDFHENVYLREIAVENLRPVRREIRLFFCQSFDIMGNSIGDTAALDPKTGGIVHYKGARYFLVNGCIAGGKGLDQHAVGQKHSNNKEGTFRDAEDGLLSGNPIAQGSVDSAVALHLTLEGGGEGKLHYWLAVGISWEEVRRLDGLVKHKQPENLVKRTADYWHLWVHKETPLLDELPAEIGDLYRRSLLVLNTQIDWQGGIIAANDSDVIHFNRDTYSYVWPRDGALAANSLDLAGYPEPARNFYRFVAGVVEKEGYFLHKYNPDGTLASSWHPWADEGQEQLPIQEDETALVIWALWNHFVIYRDIEFIKPLYRPLIKRAANFMCSYRDGKTGLPLPSYDLWEERRGIPSYTVGVVFGGLTAASLFCTIFGEEDKAAHYRNSAAEIREAASLHLWMESHGRFCRMLRPNEEGNWEVDSACDASLWGLFAFGMYKADDPRLAATMQALRETLWVEGPVGGVARYERDLYHRQDERLPGNPWVICTLWLADYVIDKARSREEMAEAISFMRWVADHAHPSGVLPEQVHPKTGEPLSVSPLTWSHATFVATTQRLLRKLASIEPCPACSRPRTGRRGVADWLEKLYGRTCESIRGGCRVK
jgi:GH15 family glucan-1,4-alpha-glucosidase